MDKNEILAASRKENQNKDLVEMEIAYKAGSIAARVGAAMCFIISVIARAVTGEYLLSPWVIYFCIVATHWAVRAFNTRKRSDVVLCLLFSAVFVTLLVLLILQLVGVPI